MSTKDDEARAKHATLVTSAKHFDSELKKEFGEELFRRGGTLFLGKNYAHSNRIFLGINVLGDNERFDTDLEERNLWDYEPSPDSFYWRQFLTFIREPGLREWFDKATAALCVPWRTSNCDELKRLNACTKGRVYEYAGKLIQQMVEDHLEVSREPRCILVAAGKFSLDLLGSFYNFDWNQEQYIEDWNNEGGIYQWHKVHFPKLVVYQVPHFAWARSSNRLLECANWPARNLGVH